MAHTDERNNFIRQIEPALWQTNELTGNANKNQSLLESRVFESKYNAILTNILETGTTERSSKDNYTKNYELCQKLIDGYAKDEPLTFYSFINNILNNKLDPIT